MVHIYLADSKCTFVEGFRKCHILGTISCYNHWPYFDVPYCVLIERDKDH